MDYLDNPFILKFDVNIYNLECIQLVKLLMGDEVNRLDRLYKKLCLGLMLNSHRFDHICS